MARIKENTSWHEACLAVCEGNPGALRVCVELAQQLGVMTAMLVVTSFDELEIYGPKIWVVFKDDCGMDAVKVVQHVTALLRKANGAL